MADPIFPEETVFPDADGAEEFSDLMDGADLPPEEVEGEVVSAELEEENPFLQNGVF